MRYVSKKPEALRDRVEAVRRMTPPPPHRKARQDWASKEDFADIVGASRSRVYAWLKGTGEPEERFRIRLAELSRGRFDPDDFRRSPSAAASLAPLERRIERLEKTVERLERHIFGSGASQAQ